MAPKGKREEKKKPKVSGAALVAERTFGMKNKKGGKAQLQIQRMTTSAAAAGTPEERRKAADKAAREREKLAAEEAKRETAKLLETAQVQRVPFGVDSKTVLCQFFKRGHCEKGKKCKFAHDLNVERKGAKKDLYQDTREVDEEKRRAETSADWDEEKLRSVVLSKKGNQKSTTEKVCKFFIEAVEEGKYGWFWTCPNGGDKCMYQHKLPPGFILKTKEQRAAEKALMDKSPLRTLTLEDWLESERHKLTGTLTPVTPATFAAWKRSRLDKKAGEEQARLAKEATGRALYEQGGWKDDEDGSDEDDAGGDDDDDGAWNLQRLRLETEALREKKEAERIGGGVPAPVAYDYDGAVEAGEHDGDGVDDGQEPAEAEPVDAVDEEARQEK